MKTGKERKTRDPWLSMLAQRASMPDLYEWRYRLAVTQQMLRELHPQRESIR